jgi:hypothetical protein
MGETTPDAAESCINEQGKEDGMFLLTSNGPVFWLVLSYGGHVCLSVCLSTRVCEISCWI